MVKRSPQGHGLWHFIGSPAVLAATSGPGFGWHCLDMQHGLWREEDVVAVFASGPRDDIAVRVRSGLFSDIGFALDAGSTHIIVPMISTTDEASAAVFAVRYPPLGGRSWGPIAPLSGGSAPDPKTANEQVRLSVMIETSKGLENINNILDTPGINSVFVGPYDLALDLGTDVDGLFEMKNSPLKLIKDACRARNLPVSAYAGSRARAVAFEALGYEWTVTASDTSILAAAASGNITATTAY